MQDEPARPSPRPPSPTGGDTAVPLDPTRPFALREYEWAFAGFVKKAVDSLMVAKSKLFSKLKPMPASEIHISRNTTEAGEIVENNPIVTLLPIAIDFKDVVAGNLEPITETINSAAEEGVATVEPQFLDYMGKVTELFGTRVDTDGASFDHNAVRRIVESSDFDFNENGAPNLESWVFRTYNPTQLITFDEMMQLLPPRTSEETRQWDEMIERKRIEFNAKRRRRTLS
jgi:hypothetical protein